MYVTENKPWVRQNNFGTGLKIGLVYFRVDTNSKKAYSGLLRHF